MNLLGMGTLEIVTILLIAFIFLGPSRMAEAARFLGKIVGDLRRMSAELPTMVLEEEDAPIVRRGGARTAATKTDEAGTEEEADGPVAFQRKPAVPPAETEAQEEKTVP